MYLFLILTMSAISTLSLISINIKTLTVYDMGLRGKCEKNGFELVWGSLESFPPRKSLKNSDNSTLKPQN